MLPTINLLPWRAERQKRLNRRFYLHLLLACSLAVLLSGLAGIALELFIVQQKQRNDVLQQASDAFVDASHAFTRRQQEYQHWQSQSALLETLENGRMQTAHLLSQLAFLIPEQLQLSHLQRDGEFWVIRGEARTSKAIAELVTGVEGIRGWEDVVLSDIRAIDNMGNQFELSFRQEWP